MPYYPVAVRSENIRLITTSWGEVQSIRARYRDQYVDFRKFDTYDECEDHLNEFYGCYNTGQQQQQRNIAATPPPPPIVAPPTPPSSTRKPKRQQQQQVSDSVTLSQDFYHQNADGSKTGVKTTATFTRKGGRSNKMFDSVMPVFSHGSAVAAEALQKATGGSSSSKLASKLVGNSNSKARTKQPATQKRITAGPSSSSGSGGSGRGRGRRGGSPVVDCTGFDCDLPRKMQRVSTGRVTKRLPAPPPPRSRNYGASEKALEVIRQRQMYESNHYDDDDEDDEGGEDGGLPSYDDAMGYQSGGRILEPWGGCW